MPKRIKNVSDLPKWFKLDKYLGAAELTACGWYEQLSIRRDCFRWLPQGDDAFQRIGPIEKELLGKIREVPIVDLTSDIILSVHFLKGPLWDLLDNSNVPHYSLGIHSLTPRQFMRIVAGLSQERATYLFDWYAHNCINVDLDEERLYPCKEWIDKPIQESYVDSMRDLTPLVVDLDLPDKLLIDTFKTWLKAERRKSSPSNSLKRFKKPDLIAWNQFGVLPWLDLYIWSKEAGVNIPNRVLADAIFPPGEGGEETVRKTTRPIALCLVDNKESDGFPLSSLAAQAAEELHNKSGRK